MLAKSYQARSPQSAGNGTFPVVRSHWSTETRKGSKAEGLVSNASATWHILTKKMKFSLLYCQQRVAQTLHLLLQPPPSSSGSELQSQHCKDFTWEELGFFGRGLAGSSPAEQVS